MSYIDDFINGLESEVRRLKADNERLRAVVDAVNEWAWARQGMIPSKPLKVAEDELLAAISTFNYGAIKMANAALDAKEARDV